MEFMGDAMAGMIQYGNRTDLCDFISKNVAGKPYDEGESNLIKWIKSIGKGDITDNDLEVS